MKAIQAIVRESLARHLDREPSAIHDWQRVEEDLDLTPLELVLVALELEEEDVRVPFEQLAAVRTVGDLLALFARARTRGEAVRTASRRAVQPSERRKRTMAFRADRRRPSCFRPG
jgi:acyl carrier protein